MYPAPFGNPRPAKAAQLAYNSRRDQSISARTDRIGPGCLICLSQPQIKTYLPAQNSGEPRNLFIEAHVVCIVLEYDASDRNAHGVVHIFDDVIFIYVKPLAKHFNVIFLWRVTDLPLTEDDPLPVFPVVRHTLTVTIGYIAAWSTDVVFCSLEPSGKFRCIMEISRRI